MKQKVVLFDIDYTLFNTDVFKETQLKKHSVYDEVYDVLKKLSKIARLAIFSEGETNFQKTKLHRTDIMKYFNEHDIHISKSKIDKLTPVIRKYSYGKLFLVDDKLSILFDAKRMLPKVFTIWMKRGMYAENQKEIKGFKPDFEVKSLKEIVSIIHNS
ncbi:MAG: hypothetical protein A3B44_02420 [Candidatus Levybacteria bacterium RIFCSPLOWO2_01_FULL_38_21]|nr:MAG: hypothetical protein A3B44_02420 [Candidatus Levybacteria bacterium RIFCSPLOWO2_01_FULL_38_21]